MKFKYLHTDTHQSRANVIVFGGINLLFLSLYYFEIYTVVHIDVVANESGFEMNW